MGNTIEKQVSPGVGDTHIDNFKDIQDLVICRTRSGAELLSGLGFEVSYQGDRRAKCYQKRLASSVQGQLQCSTCKRRFVTTFNLNNHLKSCHAREQVLDGIKKSQNVGIDSQEICGNRGDLAFNLAAFENGADENNKQNNPICFPEARYSNKISNQSNETDNTLTAKPTPSDTVNLDYFKKFFLREFNIGNIPFTDLVFLANTDLTHDYESCEEDITNLTPNNFIEYVKVSFLGTDGQSDKSYLVKVLKQKPQSLHKTNTISKKVNVPVFKQCTVTDTCAFTCHDKKITSEENNVEVHKEPSVLDNDQHVIPSAPIKPDINNSNKSSKDLSSKCSVVNGRKKTFKCHLCTSIVPVFRDFPTYNEHLRKVHGKYSCPQCDSRFELQSCLKKHLEIHNIGGLYKCDECGQEFAAPNKLTKHQKVHQTFPCVVCGKVLKKIYRLKTHQKQRHTVRVLTTHQCLKCKREWKSEHMLKKHICEADLHCSVCDRKYKTKPYLQLHMLSHSDERPYSCHICSKRYKNKNILTTHLKIHTEGQRFLCHICSKRFSTLGNLYCHIRYSHIKQKPFKCHQCGKAFPLKKRLSSHIAGVHLGDKLHKCSKCNWSTSYRANLFRHMALHTEEPQFKCQHCGRRFFQKQGLKHHEKNRSCQRKQIKETSSASSPRQRSRIRRYPSSSYWALPVECPKCHETVNQRYNLKRHMQKHTEEPQFMCKRCDKTFFQKQSLTDHENRRCCLKKKKQLPMNKD